MERAFKTKSFNRWLRKSNLNDQALVEAVSEMSKGLIDAYLGKGLVKKRIALPGRGKSGGVRALLATNKKDRWIFLHGFQKMKKEIVQTKNFTHYSL